MAKTHERVCISVPIALSNELRTAYPHMEFSGLITQLLTYAHAANFMAILEDVTENAEEYREMARSEVAKKKPQAAKTAQKKPSSKVIAKAVEEVVAPRATVPPPPIETFGIE